MVMLLETIAAIIINSTYLFLRVSSNGEFPAPLSSVKEKEHFLKYKAGDMESRNILIERNLRLVAHIVKKYYTIYKDQDDLISIGTIGLIKAIDTFNIDNGARFATYACTCVKNEILMYFRSIKKTQCETSIYDSIDIDKDGNAVTYICYLPKQNKKRRSHKTTTFFFVCPNRTLFVFLKFPLCKIFCHELTITASVNPAFFSSASFASALAF